MDLARLGFGIGLRLRVREQPRSPDSRDVPPCSSRGLGVGIKHADAGTGETLGLLVDEVHQVWRLAAEEIEPSAVLGGEQPPHIAGIGRPTGSGGTILILLDLRPILETA